MFESEFGVRGAKKDQALFCFIWRVEVTDAELI